MYNDLFTIGPLTIHGYGLMIAIGIICAILCGLRLARRKDLNTDEIYNIAFVCVIFGFLGSKLLYCIVEWKSFIHDPLSTLGSGGFVVYGGIISGTLAGAIYCRIRKLSFIRYFDIVLPSVAVAQGFGRIGCFLAGCCYGRETDSCIGVTFRNSDFAPNDVSLYPTQLFSSAGCFLIAVILFVYSKRNRKYGSTGALYLILYSIGRFAIEFFRNDYRGAIGPLSTSQFISVFVLITGIVIYVMSQKDAFMREIQDTH